MTEEFLNLVHPGEAVQVLLEGLPEGGAAIEKVEVSRALGRVIAGDITAPEDIPGFDRSSMDGFAVLASDTFAASEGLPAYLELAGEVPMGSAGTLEVTPGQAVRISTGGVMPEGSDAVVMVENTETDGLTVEVVKGVAPGENVIRKDEDIASGALLFSRGQVLGPAQAGALVALGITEVTVYRLPVVGVISTGNELVPPSDTPGPGQVRDVNSTALAASVVRAGCLARRYGIVADEFGLLLEASRRALAECDALVISGGSSMGVRDITVDILDRLGSPGTLAHGIYLKPGKPTLVAVCDGKPALGLPGNPASALTVFQEVMVPVLAALRGENKRGGPSTVEAVLDRSVVSATGRLELVPVSLGVEGGVLRATPIPGKANLIGTLARANGNVRIPEGSEGIERGERVKVEIFGPVTTGTGERAH
ncbi:MAG: molybdopterin molybdenumtransferase MoeA [Actinobacteria bacterium]|nr:molybdopterin molybdenumtransferase MoeA [Actinomycetota bacterium]